MIIQMKVTKVQRSRKDNRIDYIEGRYISTLALCHSGKYLYQDKHPIYEENNSENALNAFLLNSFLHKHRTLSLICPSIKCCIDKERYIYDRDMPHLSYEIDELKIGDYLTAMIVDNEGGDGDRGQQLKCSLQNSKILGSK